MTTPSPSSSPATEANTTMANPPIPPVVHYYCGGIERAVCGARLMLDKTGPCFSTEYEHATCPACRSALPPPPPSPSEETTAATPGPCRNPAHPFCDEAGAGGCMSVAPPPRGGVRPPSPPREAPAPGMDEVVREVVRVLCRDGYTTAATILNVTWSREKEKTAPSPLPPPPDLAALVETMAHLERLRACAPRRIRVDQHLEVYAECDDFYEAAWGHLPALLAALRRPAGDLGEFEGLLDAYMKAIVRAVTRAESDDEESARAALLAWARRAIGAKP